MFLRNFFNKFIYCLSFIFLLFSILIKNIYQIFTCPLQIFNIVYLSLIPLLLLLLFLLFIFLIFKLLLPLLFSNITTKNTSDILSSVGSIASTISTSILTNDIVHLPLSVSNSDSNFYNVFNSNQLEFFKHKMPTNSSYNSEKIDSKNLSKVLSKKLNKSIKSGKGSLSIHEKINEKCEDFNNLLNTSSSKNSSLFSNLSNMFNLTFSSFSIIKNLFNLRVVGVPKCGHYIECLGLPTCKYDQDITNCKLSFIELFCSNTGMLLTILLSSFLFLIGIPFKRLLIFLLLFLIQTRKQFLLNLFIKTNNIETINLTSTTKNIKPKSKSNEVVVTTVSEYLTLPKGVSKIFHEPSSEYIYIKDSGRKNEDGAIIYEIVKLD